MANCHDLFLSFHDRVELTDAQRKNHLVSARNGIETKVKKYFREDLEVAEPTFRTQGSFAMDTVVNPAREDGEYDIDDGVYLSNLQDDKEEWPTPEVVHSWVLAAVKGHTDEEPVDKRTCVRVRYASDRYHADLPIYAEHNGEPYLAEKGVAGWHVSDAQAFTKWFKEAVKQRGAQLARMVRYLKAWADHQSKDDELPSGSILTTLAVQGFEGSDRDDASFAGTAKRMLDRLAISLDVTNPVDPSEDFARGDRKTLMRRLKTKLADLSASALSAMEAANKEVACEAWRKEFGDRFPSCGAEDDDAPNKAVAERTSSARVAEPLVITSPSKPWSE